MARKMKAIVVVGTTKTYAEDRSKFLVLQKKFVIIM
jgi:hypothetical protein